jgi:hypothetical protein
MTLDVKAKILVKDITGAPMEGIIVGRVHDVDLGKVGWPDQNWGDAGQYGPVAYTDLEVIEVLGAALVADANDRPLSA